MKRPSLIFPLFLIVSGVLWFLKSVGWFPQTATLLSGLLVGVGLLVLILDGINKQSIVVAPLLMYGGAALYGHRYYGLETLPLIGVGAGVVGF